MSNFKALISNKRVDGGWPFVCSSERLGAEKTVIHVLQCDELKKWPLNYTWHSSDEDGFIPTHQMLHNKFGKDLQ